MIRYTQNHVMHVWRTAAFFPSGLVSKAKRNTLETFLRNGSLNQPGVTSVRWSWEGDFGNKLWRALLTDPGSTLSFLQGPGPPETKDRPDTDRHTSTYRLKWGLPHQRPQQHHVTKATNGTYTLNTNILKLKATLKSTNLYIRLHGSMTAFIDFFKGTVCNSRLLSLHGSSLVLIQAGTQTTSGDKRQPVVWGQGCASPT